MKKYNVLLTNDDGVNSKGLKALRGELAKYFNVFTVAPSSQMSGISNAITLNKFRRVKQVSKNVFAISGGTTADCVKYALYSFLKGKCDIVVSGINSCANLGQDVVYSGTVGGAREAALLGVPAVAVSVYERDVDYYAEASVTVSKIVLNILKNKKHYKNICLNVNVPPSPKGIKTVPLGLKCYDENINIKTDSKNNKYYKLSGREISTAQNPASDISACAGGWVSVTPILLNQTDTAAVKK